METTHLRCGSVVFPREETGATAYNVECGTARTQRLGYAGLSLAAGGLVGAFCLARRGRHDRPGQDFRNGSSEVS